MKHPSATLFSLKRLGLSASLALVALALAPLSCTGSEDGGPDGNETGGKPSASGGKTGTGGKTGSTGGKTGTGGKPATGGANGTAGEGGQGGQGGLGGLGGSAGVCELPFETGPCKALIRVYFHNAKTERCEPAIYGGCEGNENRFATLTACERACGVERTESACEVEGVTYPSGSGDVPDPTSCNTCSCDDGEVAGCTKIGCPEPCDDGFVLGTECTECGPADECLTVHTGCLPECEPNDECPGGGFCIDGICRDLCG